MKIQKLTLSLLILVFGTLGFAFATNNQTPNSGTPSANQAVGQQQKKAKFPLLRITTKRI